MTRIQQLSPEHLQDAEPALAGILHACVHDGASIGFVLPFDMPQARAFWADRVFPAVRTGGTVLFGAYLDDVLVGTVQLGIDLPPNQPHRADVGKLLVHPDARRRGIGRALMLALLSKAERLGKTLLVLDTRSTDPSRRLYRSLGFEEAGEIPGYCRNPFSEELEATTYMYKTLG